MNRRDRRKDIYQDDVYRQSRVRDQDAAPGVSQDQMAGLPVGRQVRAVGLALRPAPREQPLPGNPLQVKLHVMKIVTMLEFRQNAEGVLRRVARGERLVLSHRGKPTARLEPLERIARDDWANDPFLSVRRRATASPKGKTRHADIDRVVYGRP